MAQPEFRSVCAPLANIIRAPKRGKLEVGILSPQMLCLATHWDNPCKREQLCRREIGQDCPFCIPAYGRQHSYYAIATTGISQPPAVLHLTVGAVNYCPSLVERLDNCRGLVLLIERIGRAHAVRATVRDTPMNPDALIDPGDWLWPFLLRLFRLPLDSPTQPNPNPPRLDARAAAYRSDN